MHSILRSVGNYLNYKHILVNNSIIRWRWHLYWRCNVVNGGRYLHLSRNGLQIYQDGLFIRLFLIFVTVYEVLLISIIHVNVSLYKWVKELTCLCKLLSNPLLLPVQSGKCYAILQMPNQCIIKLISDSLWYVKLRDCFKNF